MFEAFPNELILEIFSYLELTELYRAFSSLNIRFEALLYTDNASLHARLPAKFNLPLEQFLHRINSITLINWHPKNVLPLLQSKTLPRLNSLTIESTTNLYFGPPTDDILHRIISFPELSRCTIDIPTTFYIHNYQLSTSTSIRYLKLQMITLDMLFFLLMHVPELSYFSVWLNSNGRRFDSQTYDPHYCCLKLKEMVLGLHNDISFEEVLFLLRRMPVLHTLRISGSVWDQEFLNYHHWKHLLLGEQLFPLLRQLRIKLAVRRISNTPIMDVLLPPFRKTVFRQAHFHVTDDQSWIYLKC